MQLSTFPFSISQVTVLYLQQLHRGFWLSSLPGSEASTKKQKKKKKKKKEERNTVLFKSSNGFLVFTINNKKTKTNTAISQTHYTRQNFEVSYKERP